MNTIHKTLSDKWSTLSLIEQLSNIGSEVSRIIIWKNKDKKIAREAFDRALELFDFTLQDKKNKQRLKEVCRAREFFTDWFLGKNTYNFTDDYWQKYFLWFAYEARKRV
jgi:hypothetical protein